MKKKVVGNVQGNVLGMMADLSHKLQHGVRTPQQLDKFLKGENPFAGLDYSVILSEWEKYYWKIHDLKTDFSGVSIPEAGDEFSWFICRPEKFFAERAFSGGKKLCFKWKWTDKSLDDVLDMSFGRDGKTKPYIVRVRPNWEADEDLKNLSAIAVAERRINTVCLTERLLLGDFLYWNHEKHLDVKNTTFCTGSRVSDGSVPRVRWLSGKVHVGWDYPVNDRWHSRRAVS